MLSQRQPSLVTWDGECYVEPREETRRSPRPSSPVYTNLKELKLVVHSPPSPCGPPVQVLDLWERHVCPETGRNFYLNSVTKERTWKPPRRTRNCAQSRSSTPPPNQPSPWNDGEGLQAPSNRLERQQQNRKSWDRSQSSSSRMQRSTSSESLGLAPQGGNDGRQVWRRQATVNWTSAAKITMTRENAGQQVNDWRDQSQHSCTMSDSSPVSPPAEEKSGQLNKTKIAEGGRKLKKNWSSCWVVLAGNSLAFYKEAKAQGAGTKRAGNRPESSMDLRGALIEWTKDMSSKKHVFRIRTVTGNEFLLQSENEDYIRDWYRTIKSVIDTLDRENPLNYPLVYSLRRSASAELLDCSGDEEEVLPKDTKPKESRRISLRRLNSDSSERKRVKNRIRKFISKRPPLQTLQEKGLIKDQVFGCRLDALCEREKSTVPKFVRMCIEAVEKRGLDVDGIYRVSGNLAIIQKLRFAVDHERAVTTDGRYLFPDETCRDKLNLDDAEWEDIHVVSGALKMFFRELPEPLIPYNTFDNFIAAVKLLEHSERVVVMKQLVGNLPKPNHDTMRALFRHMQRVVEHSQMNRMSPQSLAIVFGPTLLRPEKDFLNMAVHTVYQTQVVELILIECTSLFTQDGRMS